MLGPLARIFSGRSLAALQNKVREINALEPEIEKLSDEELKSESMKLKERAANGESLDAIASRAFALTREAAKRTLNQRPFDVQILGGLVLHSGSVAEMMTGEGKTLTAVAPVYLNALAGNGVHVVTVNEYLARRDAVWMGQVYRALGLSVACLVPNAAFMYDPLYKAPEEGPATKDAVKDQNPKESELLDKERDTTGSFLVQQEFLRPASRRDAYAADITYGTNHEFGFDYLRDNLVYRVEDRVQRGHHFAIIDEVDSILIDEARTPLIIAAPDSEASDAYKAFARIAALLEKEKDYEVDEKRKTVAITNSGVEKVEQVLKIKNIYAPENIRLVHYLEESLKAKALFFRDRDYVIKNGEVIIVDEFTGRMLIGRRYQAGLHQAIEAKEGVKVKDESRTYAKVSIQNYFRMYEKISGMTGTAQTSAEEFYKVYKLDVESIPPNRPLARKDMNDLIYKNFRAKVDAVVREVAERRKNGQPVLLGTTSISKNEIFSAALSEARIPHEVLNAKNNEREGAIIAQAGRPGSVTVATNVAGRGVDILLGGNPSTSQEADKVRKAGGLHVIGTERHEARRIDNQLRGRSGRQGDPGSTQFFLSAEDDLLRIFGGDRLKSTMEKLKVPDDEPIAFGFVTKAVAQAQEKVEGANFDLRKHLLDYDDILNKQRSAVYKRRSEMLSLFNKEDVTAAVVDAAMDHYETALAPVLLREGDKYDLPAEGENANDGGADGSGGGGSAGGATGSPSRRGEIAKFLKESMLVESEDEAKALIANEDPEAVKNAISARAAKAAENPLVRNQMLSILDMLWMNHLEDLEALQESVGLRAYGQRDPLVEYRQEAHSLFKNFWNNFNGMVFANAFKMASVGAPGMGQQASVQQVKVPGAGANAAVGGEKIGRNELCPCGSGKKYKKCGLLNTEEHRKNMATGGRKHEVTGG